jgi:hypothetical protein
MMNVMLISSGTFKLVGEEILIINYILNKVSHKKLEEIPYKL